ncbi:hypothetical protein Tco_1033004 [Tanacetum coccineum]|uniref:Tf2-1-like SH3-like domain-containing protein n=1 Tax=Tanacetum coccineum TaxID=301880 RepID=A0ABQ5GFW0_9ASTR
MGWRGLIRRRKPLEFPGLGIRLCWRVSALKGVIRFVKRGKQNPRNNWTFKILAKVGTVAYRLELPEKLSRVHSTFHVSNLKKCLSDEPLAIPLDEIHIDEKLHFIEEPVEIMDTAKKALKQRPHSNREVYPCSIIYMEITVIMAASAIIFLLIPSDERCGITRPLVLFFLVVSPTVMPSTSVIAPEHFYYCSLLFFSGRSYVETTLDASPTDCVTWFLIRVSDTDSFTDGILLRLLILLMDHESAGPCICQPVALWRKGERRKREKGGVESRETTRTSSSHEFPYCSCYFYCPSRNSSRISKASHASPRSPISHFHTSSSSSSSDSSPVHSLGLDAPDQAYSGSSTRDVSPRLCYPPRRASRCSEAFRRWCAAPLSTLYPPTTSESSSRGSSEIPMHSISYSAGPSRKRCRSPVDSVSLSMPVTGSLAPTRADHLPPRKRFRDSYSTEASLEEDVEVGLIGTIWVDIELGDAEAIYSLRMKNLKVRAMLDIERGRVSSLRLHTSLSQEEFRPLGQMVSSRTMTNTRSGMTHAAIEEMIDQRVNAALEAHQVNQNLELSNGNGNGNGNGNDNGNGNGNDNGNGKELMKLMTEVYCPRNEIQKMETELWNLSVKNNDIASYTQRFQDSHISPKCSQRGQNVARALCGCNIEEKNTKCGAQGHYRNDCPKIKNQNRGNKARVPDASGRAYALGGGDVEPGSYTVTGNTLLNDHHAYMLFDSGADKSFVSNTFSALLDITPYALDVSYAVELADGRTSKTTLCLWAVH